MCKKSDARGPIVSLRCTTNRQCELRNQNPRCVCINDFCDCHGDPLKSANNFGNLLAPELHT